MPGWGDATMTVFAIIAMLGLIGIAFYYGNGQQEVVDCNKWAQQAQDYPRTFFLAKWQDEQCRAHGITINAPIK